MLMRLSKATLAFPCRALIRSNFARQHWARPEFPSSRHPGSYRSYAGSHDGPTPHPAAFKTVISVSAITTEILIADVVFKSWPSYSSPRLPEDLPDFLSSHPEIEAEFIEPG
jgi:hypothetical protein